ncbi:MAG TPA: M12 family metallo-peptidase [Actinophytocola sp.]|uniref:M12 family metallo-peptidase n=1 Tax=Actinophytocola sp. TaxID=1872138 RepID=UPI002E0A228B|nr:M12 family metallo-peptidase [Actinophytocola sp.]
MARPSYALLVVAALAAALLMSGSPTAAAPSPDNPWTKVDNPTIASRSAQPADVRTTRFAAFTLDRPLMQTGLSRASVAAQTILALPAPSGELQRFQLVDSPVMEPGLAAAHPEIRTYAGKGIDDPTATVRADLTPLGFHASVRSKLGQWFVDPYHHLDQSLYASYYGHDLASPGPLVENEEIEQLVQDLAPAIDEPVVKLRTYRLALVTDPSYATFFGAENVTAAKVTLINRVTQVYEDETAIRLVLINDTDRTNLNTPALATGPNGPCGSAPCFTAAQLAGCSGGLLTRNNFVLGQLVGASSYDIGHIGLGVNGGGVAGLGVVGSATKGRGCTGLPTPVGDFYAVDYVAHEMGHQFGGNHPFNGTQLNCSGGNRSAANSVEPGSGTSIMAYAGICQQDNLQPHSDPYWSFRSFAEITAYVTATRPLINEVQNVALREFDTDGDAFSFFSGGQLSAPVVRGVNYTTAGIKAAIEGTRNWPAGATVTVTGFGGAATLDDTGFQVTFNGGVVAGTNLDSLGVTNATGVSAFVSETVKGGAQDNGGRVTDTANHAPVVTAPASYTIPVRTPFALTGSATDADNDAVTYLWEQTDRGGATGTALTNNIKANGPLFRQFGTAAIVSAEDTLKYYSPGENAVNGDPTRVFPDLAQIAANNTNAASGACPAAPAPPTALPPALVDCYSEFLPTPDWAGLDNSRTLHFRLTARDTRLGGGGVGSADTAVVLAPDAGPFLVTSQGSAAALRGGSAQPVTWDVAGTSAAPVDAAEVKISLSLDGGLTYPHVLAERTPNDGNEIVTLPDLATSHGRIKVEAVGNVFFDLNDADLTIQASPRLTNSGPTTVQYSDTPAVTVGANDPDGAGPALAAAATGLPAGLALTPGATSDPDARPGLRTWTVTGNTAAAPGDYPVSVAVTDESGIVSTTALSVRVLPEDAEVTYTGDALAFARDNAPVQLRATLRDGSVLGGADRSAGDVRTGTVTFTAGGQTLCTGVVGLLGTETTAASASCTATLPVGVRDVTIAVGGNYAALGTGQVTVAPAQNRIVIAAATLPETRSSGAFPADPGSRAEVALLLAHSRTGSFTTGLATAIFQSGGHRYQILGTDFESFGARSTRPGGLDFRTRATLIDVTDPFHAVPVATDLTFRLTATDTRPDAFGLTLFDGNRLLFSSNWTGTTTAETPVTNGNLVIL